MKPSVKFSIREAREEDIPAVIELAHGLAVYEKLTDIFAATPELYRKYGWGPDAIFKALLAENTGKKGPRNVGLALYYYTYSSFTGRPTLWLEDIYVPEELRGQGIGTALLKRLAEIALDKECTRMEWTVLDWNESSRQFYFSLGAKAMEEWTTFRLLPADIKKLAGQDAK